MRRTPVEATVRFTPVRSKKPDKRPGSAWAALPIALIIGGTGVRGLGWERALPIAAVTAVVTAVVALLVLRNIPRQVSLTISPEQVDYRRFFRTTTIVRDDQMTSLLADLILTGGICERYLLVGGRGRAFASPSYLWGDDDLAQIVALLGTTDRTPTLLSPRQVDDEFPGIVPGHMRHPARLAAAVIVVGVILVIAVQALWAVLSAPDEVPDAAPPPEAVAPATLPSEVTAPSDRLLARLKRVVDSPPGWTAVETRIQPCEADGTWQQHVLTHVQQDEGREGQAVVAALTRAAVRAGLVAGAAELVPGTSYRLEFAAADDGEAAARVSSNLGVVSVSTTSACTPGANP